MPNNKNTSKLNPKVNASSSITTIIICVAVLLLALIIGSLVLLYPTIQANREFEAIGDSLEGGATEILVSFPSQSNYMTDLNDEKLYTDYEALVLGDILHECVSSARYSHKNNSESGNWDTRLRIKTQNGEIFTLYLTKEGELYFSKGKTRFFFTPQDSSSLISYLGL